MSHTARFCAVVVFSLASIAVARADEPALGQKIAPFRLKDAAGKAVSLDDLKDRKAIAVVFLGAECPVNNFFLPRLAEMHAELASKNVQIIGINANRQDTPEKIAAHAKKYAIPFPVLRDEDGAIADRFGAKRTPEAFVLDPSFTIRYRGRIDDQYGIDVQRTKPTRRDLYEALLEVAEGKKVSVPSTAVAGCLIGRGKATRSEGKVTFTREVARILQKNCQECHRPGQIGPMALIDYDDVTAWSGMIREVVSDRRMPPWYADPKHGKWSNDRRLNTEDYETLLAWIDQGMPRGKDEDMPPPRPFPEGWKIGKPDLVISIPTEFEVPAKMPRGGVPYKYLWVETNFDEDKWIERAEAKPGAPEVVHHILAFIVPPGKRFIPGNPDTPVLCGMAPGEQPFMLATGSAKFIPKGSRLLFQMHYTPNGKAQKDRSSIGLIFAKEPPQRKVVTLPVYNLLFRIPPGDPNYLVEANWTFKQDGYIVGLMPHMHVRGKDYLLKATYPDGKEETVLNVPRFNFNWQGVYRPVEPLRMPKGTKLHAVAHFDNSADNPNNPDPRAAVFWGDQTWEEMMIGWIDFAYDVEAPAKK